MSFDKAIAGVSNAEVQVVNSESSLLDNLAKAEVRLRNDKQNAKRSIADRLAAARARAGTGATSNTSSTSSGTNTGGYHTRFLVGRSAVGRAKEVQMIQHHFIDHTQPIKVVYGAEAPYPHELDEDMDLPNAKAIFDLTTGKMKDLSITDFFKAKEKAISAWPLMGFHKFIRMCRKAMRMCQASSKTTAVANAAALDQLMEICLRVQGVYERTGQLGTNDIRLKARMYLHLQHACVYRVVYANAIASTVFEDATDPFCARLPGYEKPTSTQRWQSPSPKKTPTSTRGGFDNSPKQDATPVSGCYLCTATDHYCNDKKFHPLVDGRHAPLSPEKKKAILKRIEDSDLTPSLKSSETTKVRRFWSQHGL